MKRLFTILIVAMFSLSVLNAQESPPQAFSYKAIIKKANGAAVANQLVNLRVSILQNYTLRTPVYVETFKITTNIQGQIDIEIGRGITSDNFSSIPWSADEFFLKVEVDIKGGTIYQFLSETQLLSVPYALFAGGVKKLQDADGDTRIVPEKSSDDDTLRFYTGGIERLQISPSGSLETFGDNHSIHFGNEAGKTSTGNSNIFIGDSVGLDNTTGLRNTVIGYNAFRSNTIGNWNTALGWGALASNIDGRFNTANGYKALLSNITGGHLVAVGSYALRNNTSGGENSAIGYCALFSNTTGGGNTAVGSTSLASNTTGIRNTAIGHNALNSNTTGNQNTAIGHYALYKNTTGSNNTAAGLDALHSNTTGVFNTAMGKSAMRTNTTGTNNTAVGGQALISNNTGSWNTAIGFNSLYSNTEGNNNTANGYEALFSNTTGNGSTATGYHALFSNTEGGDNTATGNSALYSNTSGNGNSAFGSRALHSNITGHNNTAIGFAAGVASGDLNNATAIGYDAKVNSSNKIVLGNASATMVGGYGGWTNYSDRRLKENIVNKNELGLNFISRLKPVSFNYIEDSNKRRRDGLIAQDVEQILKELGIEFSGLIIDEDAVKTMNLSYPEFVIPLITAVQELKNENDRLKIENEQVVSRIEKLEKLMGISSMK